MAIITIPKKELKTAVKESIREVFEQEFMKFRALLSPSISEKEQRDIEKRYHKPSCKIAKPIAVKI